MKKILFLILLLMAPSIFASYQGVFAPTDTISFTVISIDTLGRESIPDSVHVTVWHSNDSVYSTRSTSAGAGASFIDSSVVGGNTEYKFVDLISNIDGAGVNGNYSGSVKFFSQVEPFTKEFSFTIAPNDLNFYLAAILAIEDSIQLYLDATISSRSTFDETTDPVANVTLTATTTTVTDGAKNSTVALDATVAKEATKFNPATQTVANVTLTATTSTVTDGAKATELAKVIDSINTLNDFDHTTQNVTVVTNLDKDNYELTIAEHATIADTVWGKDSTDTPAGNTSKMSAFESYKGSGTGTSPAAVWTYVNRQLTALDEDSTTIDLDGTTVGTVSTVTDGAKEATKFDPLTEPVLLADNSIKADTYADDAANLALYGGGIWIDAAAANTNTEIGADGTPANPVSTLTAARILADTLSIQKYFFINASDFSATGLTATHEGWVFQGFGIDNKINLGSQDIDHSQFMNMTVTGSQGGTGNISVFRSFITSLGDFTGTMKSCAILDSISLVQQSDIFLLDCWSGIAGAGTPKIILGNNNENLSIRNFAGGLELIGLKANHTVSLDGRGQIIIDATSADATVAIRGTIELTNDGTNMDIVDDARLTRSEIVDDNWDEILTGLTHNIQTSAGRRLRDITAPIVRTGIARGPGVGINQIRLDVGASSIDGTYDPSVIHLIEGTTGGGQSRKVLQYEGDTVQVATVNRDWKTLPDSTTEYVIVSNPGFLTVNEGLIQSATDTTAVLNLLASVVDSVYIDQAIYLVSGTGADQIRRVINYVGASRTAHLQIPWSIIPDSTSGYIMIPYINGFVTEAMDSLRNAPIPVVVLDTTVTGKTLAVKEDSSIYQGAAGDVTAIAIAVNDTADGRHGTANYGCITTGGGAFLIDIYVIDSSSTDTLSFKNISIQTATGTPAGGGSTLTFGKIIASLDAGDYRLLSPSGQHAFDTLNFTVSANDTIDFLGYRIVSQPPIAPDKGAIEGTFTDLLGDPRDSIVVKLELVKQINIGTSAGSSVAQFVAYDTTDVTGFFRFEPIGSDIYSDTTKNKYRITGFPQQKNCIDCGDALFIVTDIFVQSGTIVDLTYLINQQ